jgi:hypothetical protein
MSGWRDAFQRKALTTHLELQVEFRWIASMVERAAQDVTAAMNVGRKAAQDVSGRSLKIAGRTVLPATTPRLAPWRSQCPRVRPDRRARPVG